MEVLYLSQKFYRPNYLNVDLDAIHSNYQALGRLHPNKIVMPVVKANAYGLGSVEVAKHLVNKGAEFIAVATLDEAIELRMHGIKSKILILGVIPPESINKAIQHRVAITVASKEWLEEAITHLNEKKKKKLWMHIKIDSGMNRLGIKEPDTYHDVIKMIKKNDRFIFEGVFTHFACADEDDDSAKKQYKRFKKVIEQDETPEYIHAQNSAGTLRFDAPICNAVRVGLSLYGYYPSKFIEENTSLRLRPSAQWVAGVLQTKDLKQGERVSYGHTYEAEEDMRIAILPVGYADGYLRCMQGAYVNINGEQCEVVGRVCMDQIVVRVSENVKAGDEAILLDHHANNKQSAEHLADIQNTINYEILCNLSRRIPRVYHTGDTFEIYNELLK